MSTPTSPKSSDESAPQFYRKPRADVFTVLLVIALMAILLATIVLWMVMQTYEYKIKGGPVAGRGFQELRTNHRELGHRELGLG